MLRVLLQYLLPLLLPFLVYAAYVALARGRLPDWLGLDGRHWLMLGGTGIVLLAISLVTWSLLTGSPPGETYIPPRFEDGRVVPGTTVAE
ncbi:MAG: DUF6111 family protein [Geminicoccaceae bacterium]